MYFCTIRHKTEIIRLILSGCIISESRSKAECMRKLDKETGDAVAPCDRLSGQLSCQRLELPRSATRMMYPCEMPWCGYLKYNADALVKLSSLTFNGFTLALKVEETA
jgi:hypothetical protein